MTYNEKLRQLMKVQDVARLLNIHINTVRRWSNQGVIKACRIGPRGDRRFRQEDIALLLLEETEHYSRKQPELTSTV